MLCAKLSWNLPRGSGEEDFELLNEGIMSPWQRIWPFKFTNLNHLHPRMLCPKFGWHWPTGSGEDEKVRSLQTEGQTPVTGILVQGSSHISHTDF